MSLRKQSARPAGAERVSQVPTIVVSDDEQGEGELCVSHDTQVSSTQDSDTRNGSSMRRHSLQKLLKRQGSPAPAALISHEELTDLRALQRTFDGAYTRTALAQLSYAILILRLFEREFYWCGLVYTVLAVQLIGIATYRYNLAMRNEDRWNKVSIDLSDHSQDSEVDRMDAGPSVSPSVQATSSQTPEASSVGPHAIHVPLFRRTFRTAGDVVALATFSTLVLEIVLAALVLGT